MGLMLPSGSQHLPPAAAPEKGQVVPPVALLLALHLTPPLVLPWALLLAPPLALSLPLLSLSLAYFLPCHALPPLYRQPLWCVKLSSQDYFLQAAEGIQIYVSYS